MDGVHSAGAPDHSALAAAAPPQRSYSRAERIFDSMRFGDDRYFWPKWPKNYHAQQSKNAPPWA